MPPALKTPQSRALQLILDPLVRFLHTEAAGGVVLLGCAAAALGVANSPWAKPFRDFWHHTHLTLGVGPYALDRPLEWWVNDVLMVLFFFVVGLEIKRELVAGELRDPRKAALPAAAALGGMVVPALIYLALQRGAPGERGWGIPMATDIAFVVGVLALLGPRVPAGLKVLMLSLAIVDDLGAVLVIAVAYSQAFSLGALGCAGGGLALALFLRLVGVRMVAVYAVVGVGVWLATYLSGVHATVAGVALGLLTPARTPVGKARLLEVIDLVAERLRADPTRDDLDDLNDEVQALVEHGQLAMSPLDRLQAGLHPWVAFVIMPLFALANAGVAVDAAQLASPVALSVVVGLLVGKPVGIFVFSWLAVKGGLARLPAGVTTPVLAGAGCLGGIGFTMSLFIATLALEGDLLTAGKVGTLAGSAVSAALGSAVLLAVLPHRPPPEEGAAVSCAPSVRDRTGDHRA
ncbi:MAG: Na+/H+ antiporter NhaA [Gemmataceae bacterium]